MHTPPAPPARTVISPDNVQIATYEFGDPDAPTVLAVHGFASSALANFHATGWVRDLVREGYHVIAIDQRGHGQSDKPHAPAGYTMDLLVTDVLTVLDTFMLDEVDFVGYSLGARVGWHAARFMPTRINRAVLGGIPDGDPLTRFRVDQAQAFVRDGVPVTDAITSAYLQMAAAFRNNDLDALIALVEGMRGGPQPHAENAPTQRVLFATGSEDKILAASKALAEATPNASFFEIPGRNHFNAPTSRAFRDAAIEFLGLPGSD
ncbi:alpha/beta fold hydrolase [Cryobacterium arcticum]|uniref:Alpha/beta hydrolase n=1 Tax=Cryobacterium arcticum TaxID=670052 RepID=A0A317ZW04_9MICO|nr:alpha/beta fold hydrolase [Cryobacterium arcticum]PXA68357.1 alpha/beta hydrolase [Cryobacterium arcticum]